jgi:hypothetical protein
MTSSRPSFPAFRALLATLVLCAAGCGGGGDDDDDGVPIDPTFRPAAGAEHKRVDAVFDNAGTTGIAVWTENSAASILESRILYSVYSSGTWSAEAELAARAEDAHIATDGVNFMAVWSGYESGIRSVYARRYGSTGWGAATALESAAGYALHARIASNGTGFCATWCQHDGTAFRIHANRFTTDWEAVPFRLDAATGAYEPDVASDGTGYAVTWYQGDGNIGAAVYDGSWTAAALTAAGSCLSPRIASTRTAGSYVVTWYRSNVIYASHHALGAWGAAQTVSPAGTCGLPGIAASGSAYCIVWPQLGAVDMDLYASIDAGTSWTPAGASAVDATAGDVLAASVASVGTGFAVAWRENEGGTVDVDYVSLYAATWSAPAVLPTGLGDCHDTPAVRRRDAATYTLVWSQAAGTDATSPLTVFARSLTTGGTLGTETDLVRGAWYGSSLAPQVAVNVAAGTALAVWEQYLNGTKGVYGSVYAGGAWGTPAAIEERGASPVVAGDGTGFLVAWIRDGSDVRARRYVPATGWGAAVTVDASDEDVSELQVASAGATACVAWRQLSGTKQSILARVLTVASSTWSSVEDIDDIDTADCGALRLAAAATSGRYGVVWVQDEANDHVYAALLDGSWGAPVHIDEGSATDAAAPDIASDGDGFCATWVQANRIYINRWTVAAPWDTTTELAIDTASALARKTPRIASHGANRYGAAWIEDVVVVANAYDGTAWQATAVVVDTGTGASDALRIAAAGGSGYALTWRESGGGVYNLYGNVLAGGSWGTAPVLLESLSRDVAEATALAHDGTYYLSLHAQYEDADPLLWQVHRVRFRR